MPHDSWLQIIFKHAISSSWGKWRPCSSLKAYELKIAWQNSHLVRIKKRPGRKRKVKYRTPLGIYYNILQSLHMLVGITLRRTDISYALLSFVLGKCGSMIIRVGKLKITTMLPSIKDWLGFAVQIIYHQLSVTRKLLKAQRSMCNFESL